MRVTACQVRVQVWLSVGTTPYGRAEGRLGRKSCIHNRLENASLPWGFLVLHEDVVHRDKIIHFAVDIASLEYLAADVCRLAVTLVAWLLTRHPLVWHSSPSGILPLRNRRLS